MLPASWVPPPRKATPEPARWKGRPTPDMGDEQLLGLHLAGCRDSFQVLVERHRGACIGLATRILRNAEAAEDEVQNAMLKAHVAAHTFNFQARFSSWLSQIVINECRMRIRVERRRPAEQCELAIALSRCPRRSPEEALAASEVTELVRHEILLLPAPLRVVLHSVLVEGRSLSECGAQLGLTRAAVKSRLLRAKQEFRLRMRRHHGAMGGLTLLR
jgi:RNA polymerase sigma-70 factor, ECF subfamily